MSDKVPFTILTGWLGAGKTTALNRMLAAPHGRKIAVLVNELGRISIDTQLIVGRGGDVLELAGGCVCCKVDIKSDLWDGIAEVVARANPDHVVLETTGIAEPAAILENLHRVPDSKRIGGTTETNIRDRIHPAGVICVIDAETGASAVALREEARAQAQTADRVLLAKLEVASADAVRRTHALLDDIAPAAERAGFPTGEAGALAMTDWVLEQRKLRAWTTRPHVHDHAHGAHHHAGQIVAVSFADDAPLVGDRVLAVLESLGARLVRAKGFVNLTGDDRRGFVERAGIRTELTYREPWGEAPRRSELVLIGDDLDEAAVRRALWACRAGT
ncbi:MAG: cobalamin synthesis protein [Myxococcales bacterium]|nr:cobalamin synthesis protein [Myxococcales bacterium]